MKQSKIIFVSPVYYDVDSFLILRGNLLDELKKKKLQYSGIHFLVVDDSSGQDHQIKKLEPFKDVSIVKPPFNLGHQRTIVFGIRSCIDNLSDNDILITLDSDGEDRPEDVILLINELEENNKSTVLAKRTKREESLAFKLCYFAFKIIFKFLTGEVINSGNYAAHKSNHLKKIIYHPYFDLCYSSSLIALNISKSFIDSPRGKRYKGKSRMNFNSLVMHGIRMMMPFMDKIATRALITFSVGFVLSLVAIFTTIMIKFFTDNAIPGWASYLVTTFLALSFIALGNFVILFSLFSQSQGNALRSLENMNLHSAKFDNEEVN